MNRLEPLVSQGAVLDFDTGAGPDILENALAYHRAGLCVLPTPAGGEGRFLKHPDITSLKYFDRAGRWEPYKQRKPLDRYVARWFMNRDKGIALVTGPVSGNAEALDFDDHGGQLGVAFESWRQAVRDAAPGLFERLYVGQTPGRGYRVLYRCGDQPGDGYGKNLAMTPASGRPGVYDTLIEWLAGGKVVMIPGGHPDAHPRGRPYTTEQGDLCDLPVIAAAEREVLIRAARSLDRREPDDDWDGWDPVAPRQARTAAGTRPGDAFNAAASWEEILEPHGWTLDHTAGDMGYWCRPGKGDGTSATTNYADKDRLHVFSSNATPFEPDKSYSKFAAYTLLDHGGDFAAAAGALSAKGYGLFAEVRTLAGAEPAAGSPAAALRFAGRDEVAPAGDGPAPGDAPPAAVARPPVDLARYRDDDRCRYLWAGYHGKYLTDAERAARVRSVEDAWRFVPPGGLLPEYLKWVLPSTDAPPVFHVAAALALAGHLLNRRVWLPAGHGRVYPNLWVAVIGESSKQRKSTAIEPVLRLLREDAAYSATLLPKAFSMEAMYSCLGHVLARPEDLAPHRVKCREWDAGPGFLDGVGLFHVDELGGFLQTLDKSYNEGGKVVLTEWYDCPPEWHKPTRTQGTYFLWRPTVTVLGASTLQWLMDNCRESDLMGGFLPRWLFVGHRGGRDYTLALRDAPSEAAYFRVKDEVERLKAVGGEAVLTADAEGLYWRWREGLEAGVPERLGGWVNRLGTYGLKLALVYQAAGGGGGLAVGEEAMVYATRFVDAVKEYLAEVVQHDLAFTDDDKERNKVVRVLRRQPGTPVPHGVALRNCRMPARKFKDVVATLEEAGHLEAVETPRGHAYVWTGD